MAGLYAGAFFDLVGNDAFGKPEFGDAINHDAAGFVEGFEHVDLVAFPANVGGNGNGGRA